MHIGTVAVFEGGDLALPGGGLDVERIHRLIEANLFRMPRYRQRLARTPLFDHPVWVDDERFNLRYHVRHSRLPHPGDERTLKRLAGRILSQQLDRGKPLWEMWIVEGLENDRFAVIMKAHHCMIDGIGSVEVASSIMSAMPDDPRALEPPPRWMPRPAPGPLALLAGELAHRAATPLVLGRAVLGAPRATLAEAAATARAVGQVLAIGLTPASPTPLNVPTGPHRRFDWTSMSLEAVREVRRALGGTVNDVVLAILSGALRRFFHRRGDDVAGLDFRAMLPVNVRTSETRMDLGNRIAMMTVRLPIDEQGARRRLERVIAETTASKRSPMRSGTRAIEEISDRTCSGLFTLFARLTALSRPYNMIVTNVPGPQMPIYLLGARLVSCLPVVPLFRNQALNIALFSYDGTLFWGFNADWDAVPDLHELVAGVERELEGLRRAAEAAGAAPDAGAARQVAGAPA